MLEEATGGLRTCESEVAGSEPDRKKKPVNESEAESGPETDSLVMVDNVDVSVLVGSFMALRKIWPVARASRPFWSSLTSSTTKRRLTWQRKRLENFCYGEWQKIHKIATSTELLELSIRISMGNKKFVTALNEKRALLVGEDVVAVDPSSRLCAGLSIMRIGRTFERAAGEKIREDKLLWFWGGCGHVGRKLLENGIGDYGIEWSEERALLSSTAGWCCQAFLSCKN